MPDKIDTIYLGWEVARKNLIKINLDWYYWAETGKRFYTSQVVDGSILKVISYCTRLNISLNRNVSHSHRTSVIDGQCKISGQEGEREADGVICSSAYPGDIFFRPNTVISAGYRSLLLMKSLVQVRNTLQLLRRFSPRTLQILATDWLGNLTTTCYLTTYDYCLDIALYSLLLVGTSLSLKSSQPSQGFSNV